MKAKGKRTMLSGLPRFSNLLNSIRATTIFLMMPTAYDQALIQVREYLMAKPDLLGVVGQALRKSFDEIIDGSRTGRYCIEQLEKTEKTYIGTKVEIVLRNELALERGLVLDNLIAGHEVDTKFTVGTNRMIPREALGQLCLLVTGNDNTGLCRMGVLRMTPEVLTNGANQDGKKSVSRIGKEQISWLVQGPMPRNFMLDLPDADRDAIMSAPSGRQAIQTLFRKATGRIIPRTVIEQVARQKDAAKRAREAKAALAAEGVQVLCATYLADRSEFMRHGFYHFKSDDWLSMPM
ncbi:MAG: restriction endonuclease [Alcaligenaceae bacterium]|nr:restriction endonuclease [Alcaligenaceae bacterium]